MSTKCIEHDTTVPIYGDHFFVNFLFPNRKDTQLHSSTKVIMYVSGKYKESFRLSKNLKTSLVYPRKDSNVVSVEDHVHL